MVLAQIGVSVTVDGTQAPGASLPLTGLDIALLVAAACALIGVGLLVLKLRPRRSEAER